MQEPVQQKAAFSKWSIYILIAVIAFGIGFRNGKVSAALPQSNVSIVDSSSGTIRGVGSNIPSDLGAAGDFSQFWDLWRILKEKYYQQPINEQQMLYGAMQGLASSFGDPYTVFFEPKAAQEFNQELSGKFSGIGAEIGIKDEQLQVIAPLPDTPAEKAGLHAGDLILKINSEDTAGMTVEKAVSLIRGKRGTAVSLFIGRYTDKKTPITLEVTMIRDEIVVKSVQIKYLKENIALIDVSNFTQDTQTQFSAVVQEALAKGVKGVILDLRNNPGGYLDQAISMASEWTGDMVVVKEQRQGKIVEEYYGNPTARLRNMPTIVLMNDGSASASEIVAGALQDYAKAKIVGIKSFGKGSVQEYQDLPDGSAVKITIAEWLTPKDRSINKQGIEPDVTVDLTLDDYNAQRDPQLDASIGILTGATSTKTSASATPKAGTSKVR